VRVLVTSARMPFALALIRKLAEEGHEVYASDAYAFAPGSHSRFVTEHFVTAAPRDATEAFIADVARIANEQAIELIVPSFEEAFYLSTRHDLLAGDARLFFAPFATLAPLHDKASFERLAVRMGLPMAKTVLATSDAELREGLERFPRYFARAAFSRGGVTLLTNAGPLAGKVAVGDCHPTPANPWLVQEFVEGETFCTYSTVHEGRVTAHCAYAIPLQWEHSTGIQFTSLDGAETLELVRKIAGATAYTGQISFDFIASPDGAVLVECNPRATDGVLLMGSGNLVGGILDTNVDCGLVAPGEQIQLDLAVFAEAFAGGLRELPSTFADLLEIRGADRGWHDALPGLYSFLALIRSERLHFREHEALFEAMARDITWDGDPIAGMSAEDARVLESLGAPGT
jgi:predicted ATP-grasp superfamily ATP-dependent carboligase